ncbi:uncharacterized protein LOC135843901 [Planococcus citri]|uniref:uncharacterized protein LOC135843901 n=1 Tax=Planococcus citri TaxID=170843 RepID=UPI0031F773FB
MLLIFLFTLYLHLPLTEPVIRRTWARRLNYSCPTRPINCRPHLVKPCISFKDVFHEHPFTLGTSDFVELLQKNEVFFDNSLFIKTVLDTFDRNPTMLILAPNKWGKTTNLKMLKTFLEIPVNDVGERISPEENSTIYKLFRYGEIRREDGTVDTLRIPLRISRFEYLFPMFQGKYPVIYVSFKHVSGTTYAEIEGKIQKAISKVFWEHKYMLRVLNESLRKRKRKQKGNIPNAERKMSWFKENLYSNSPFEKTLIGSLVFLSEILRKHFRKKVFVLIDDYDASLYSALQTAELSKDDTNKVLHLIANLLDRTFKGNVHLKRGIAVGNSQLTEYKTNSWKNYDLHSVAENPYPMMHYFGLTRNNFQLVLDHYNITEELAQQAFEWYGGYTASNVVGQSFCNPASVIRFLNSKKIASYFHETCNLEVINKLLRISSLYREDIFDLLSQKPVLAGERLILNERTLSGLQDIFTRTETTPETYYEEYANTTMLFHAYLIDQGVLTIVRSSGSANLAKIPNKETALEFSKRMIRYISEKYHIRQEPLKYAAAELLRFTQNSEVDSSQLEYRLRLIYTRSFTIAQSLKNETYYVDEFERKEYSIFACVILEMQCLSKLYHKVYYDKHFGADIVIRDITKKHAVIIQIKDNDSAENALRKAENYGHMLNSTDTSTITYIGINILPTGKVQVRAKTQRVEFMKVETPTTCSLTYPEFRITTKKKKKKSTLKYKRATKLKS